MERKDEKEKSLLWIHSVLLGTEFSRALLASGVARLPRVIYRPAIP